MKFLIIIGCLTIGYISNFGNNSAIAQHKPIMIDNQMKDVTAAGPFPFYINISPGRIILDNADFKWLAAVYNSNEDHAQITNLNSAHWGYGFDFGWKIFRTLSKERWPLFLESSYNVGTKQGKVDAGIKSFKLTIRHFTYSTRIGTRVSYFPFSFHVQAGIIWKNSIDISSQYKSIVPTKDGMGDTVVDRTSREVLDYNILFTNILFPRSISNWGMDLRFRIYLMDPIGAGGGIGIFFEYRGLFFPKNSSSERDDQTFARTAQIITNNERLQPIAVDRNYSSFSMGISTPIALKFNFKRVK